jgi:superfamily II DNA or RNA helicase
MNHKIVAYTLVSYAHLGCLPECVLVDTDAQGVPGARSVKLKRETLPQQADWMDKSDVQLAEICFQLDPDFIARKVKYGKNREWSDIERLLADTRTKDETAQFYRNYLMDYVQKRMDQFFHLLGSKPLYFPVGKFPFMWKRIHRVEDVPELMYCFDNQPDKIVYSLDIRLNNRPLNISKGVLVTQRIARILAGDKLYEFDSSVDGMKLVPFFIKPFVTVLQSNAPDYIEKVIMPLTTTNRVVAKGFDIQLISGMSNAVLRVRENRAAKQLSLFDSGSGLVQGGEVVLELLFEYENFRFWAGQGAKTTRLELRENDFTITRVERDRLMENDMIRALQQIGLDLDGKIKKLSYTDGIDFINRHLKAIESAGIDVQLEAGGEANRFFIGEQAISVVIEEERDWFDIKGRVVFGEYEIPFIVILNHIRRNQPQLRLPGGEYAIIPQAWFDEYRSLAEFSRTENGKVILKKHHVMVTGSFVEGGNMRPGNKVSIRALLEGNGVSEFELPKGFNGRLRKYQQEGYNWLRHLNALKLGGCLADDMGLGKTVQTLCLLQWSKEQGDGMSLLVVPTTLLYNWRKEAAQFCSDLVIYTHTGPDRTVDADSFAGADLIITSYAILRRDVALLCELEFNYVILDEAQAIKNPHSLTATACFGIKAQHYLTLTGTPVENSLSDLWTQMHFVNRNILGSLPRFMKESKSEDKLALYRRLIRPFLLRRHKSEVLHDLPEKSIIVQYCDMDDSQQEFYRQIRNQFRDRLLDQKKSNQNAIALLEGLMRLRQAANHPVLVDKAYTGGSGKFELVCEMLEDIQRQGNKALVFSSFTGHLRLFRSYLDEQNFNYCYIDGSTTDRQEQVEKFQSDDDYPFFLLSLKAGGTGLNLTRASYVLLLDPWWNPAAEAQAFDRAHRIGQTNKVFVYKFITRSTVEEKILLLQDEKKALFHTMIDENPDHSIKMNVDELLEML